MKLTDAEAATLIDAILEHDALAEQHAAIAKELRSRYYRLTGLRGIDRIYAEKKRRTEEARDVPLPAMRP